MKVGQYGLEVHCPKCGSIVCCYTSATKLAKAKRDRSCPECGNAQAIILDYYRPSGRVMTRREDAS